MKIFTKNFAIPFKLRPLRGLQKKRKATTNCVAALIFFLAFYFGAAVAGTYGYSEIPENEDAPKIPVCRDFMENLRRLGSPPMVCDRKFDSTVTQFEWPKWQRIDPAEHRDLVEQIWQYQYGWAYDQESLRFKASPAGAKGTQEYHAMLKASIEDQIRRGDLKLDMTKVFMDDSLKDVLRISEGENTFSCKPERWSSSPPPFRQYYIVDHDLQKIDFAATENSALNGYSSHAKDTRPDLFLYRGQPFVAAWYENGVGRGRIEIFGDYRNYCFIDYTETYKGLQS